MTDPTTPDSYGHLAEELRDGPSTAAARLTIVTPDGVKIAIDSPDPDFFHELGLAAQKACAMARDPYGYTLNPTGTPSAVIDMDGGGFHLFADAGDSLDVVAQPAREVVGILNTVALRNRPPMSSTPTQITGLNG